MGKKAKARKEAKKEKIEVITLGEQVKAQEDSRKKEAETKEIADKVKSSTNVTTVKPVATTPVDTTPYRNTYNTTTLFCYGTLNVHDVQRDVWGEAMEGEAGTLTDYELKLWGGRSAIMYVEKKVGETVVGKAYELTDEQIKATDRFETDMYKRKTVRKADNTTFDVYVRNPEYGTTTKVELQS